VLVPAEATREVAELRHVAEIREAVLVAAPAFEPPGVREEHARLTDQIERDVGEGDVFFQDRPVAAPFGQALAEDKRAVAEAQQVVDVLRGACAAGGHVGASHHMCFTSSGNS
jgi:hypothetical protein